MSDDKVNYDEPVTQPSKMKSALTFIFEILKVIVLAGITIALIRFFLFKPFYVKGASMEPNFYDHEYLIVDELSYRLRAPERGEVIVFNSPLNPDEYFLKRIIGLPGEHIKIIGGHLTIYNSTHPEGVSVDESYLPKDLATSGDINETIGNDEYYVLGDNRGNSLDSRRFGAIKRNVIVGRAFFRGWPLSRVQKMETPSYTDLNN